MDWLLALTASAYSTTRRRVFEEAVIDASPSQWLARRRLPTIGKLYRKAETSPMDAKAGKARTGRGRPPTRRSISASGLRSAGAASQTCTFMRADGHTDVLSSTGMPERSTLRPSRTMTGLSCGTCSSCASARVGWRAEIAELLRRKSGVPMRLSRSPIPVAAGR